MTNTPPPTDPLEANNTASAGCMARIVRLVMNTDMQQTTEPNPSPEIRDKILEIVDEKHGAFWGEFYTALIPPYEVEAVRLALKSLVNDGTLRMKEDDQEHDWEYLRCRPNAKHIHPEPNTKDMTTNHETTTQTDDQQPADQGLDDAICSRRFSIRRDILNLPLDKWKIADSLDLSSITPREWETAIGGKGGFLTALMNDKEREFVHILYYANKDYPHKSVGEK